MPTALSVNVNKVALLRNSRPLDIPNVLRAAALCLEAGAAGITVHPRPDARHIRRADVYALAELLNDWPGAEFNIEGNPFHNLMDFVRDLRPHQCTFVPDDSSQKTSDHGWNLATEGDRLRPLVEECKALGVRVSLFMDPVAEAMCAASLLGADRIELYTEPYAAGFQTSKEETILAQYTAAAAAAKQVGLGVNAGHDLNRDNLECFLRRVPGVKEVSIGHALIADALEYGYCDTVRAYLRCIEKSTES